jgi:sugar/nucleoside kinase (ribokinase family)
LRAAELGREHGGRVSVDLASWSGIRDSGLEAFCDAVRFLAPDVVFANDEEAREVGTELVEALWIVSHGARGCSFGDDVREALPVSQIVDTTGAGDALAAGWILGGPDLALEAAARCVEQVGAIPLASLQ